MNDRRYDMMKWTPAEKAIYDACLKVEEAGAHPLLTDAVNLLQAAREKVADFVDGIKPETLNASDAAPLAHLRNRYRAAVHAMQSGVAMWFQIESKESPGAALGECSPKHLRVGVNSALSDGAALAALLIKKGVITEVEYTEAIKDGMEREVTYYESRLSKRMMTEVTLK